MAQSLAARVQALVPTLTTSLSPVTAYQPLPTAVTWGTNVSGTGNVLLGGTGDNQSVPAFPLLGVWVAPDANGDGSDYQVQVECFGGGAGGGGGSTTTGGGGGGAGEYAAEPSYAVKPGKSYVWVVSDVSSGGSAVAGAVTPGVSAGPTIFDLLGVGLPGGVTAHGGIAGDAVATGEGGRGGTGSANTVHCNGGNGGTVVSGIGSDDPAALSSNPALWANGAATFQPAAQYMMCDVIPLNSGNTVLSDFSGSGLDAAIDYLAGSGSFYTRSNPAPVQVPTFTSAAGSAVTNATAKGDNGTIPVASLTTTTAVITLPPIGLANVGACTISAWIAQSPQAGGVFSDTAPGSWGTIAANARGKAYSGSGNITGFALGLINKGTASAPSWVAEFKVGDASNSHVTSAQGLLNAGAWNHVVATFHAGAMALYINGSLVASGSASISVIPASGHDVAIGASPDGPHVAGYFGYLSNVWFGTDALNATGVAEAFGAVPAQGGAGGGASGGSGGAGGNGASSSGATGGAGGTPHAVGASIAQWTTGGSAGAAGSNSATDNATSFAATAGGGGGCGSTPSPGAGGAATFGFTSAASYNGTDANGGTASGALYNPGQQGTNSLLFTGAGPNDYATGAKNSMLVLDPSLYTLLGFTPDPSLTFFDVSNYVTQVSLTVFNANPLNPAPVILEVSYSFDTVLPGSYTGSTIQQSLGQLVIPAGAASATMDLTQTGFYDSLIGLNYPDRAGAIILGPGASPTFEAYGQPTAQAFNCEVYGPGSAAPDGSSVAPFLTLTYSALAAGSPPPDYAAPGAPGGLYVTYVNPAGVAVAAVEAFAVTDPGGNKFAQGFTGTITPFQPGATPAKPETWHKPVSLLNGWTQQSPAFQYRMNAEGNHLIVRGIISSGAMTGTTFYTLPDSNYWPTSATGVDFGVTFHTSTGYTQAAFGRIDTSGNISIINATTGTGAVVFDADIPLNLT
jgi:hypothetical protein